jgi:8-oxo-dGTP pyrophosphatase MutT (NUDIX family)
MSAPGEQPPQRTPRGGAQRIPRPADWQHGDPTPWDRPGGEVAPRLSIADVRRRLVDLPPARVVPELPSDFPVERRSSAVLVPLFDEGDEARLILTKRPETMPTHQGEIAFPGGKLEPSVDSDLRATALREAHEEIGLEPSDVEIIAELDGIGTVGSRFVIAPFVGVLPARPQLRRDTREVVRVFDVALSELLAPGVHHAERWHTSNATSSNGIIEVHFFELDDETVWGATARILYGFLSYLVADREPGAA